MISSDFILSRQQIIDSVPGLELDVAVIKHFLGWEVETLGGVTSPAMIITTPTAVTGAGAILIQADPFQVDASVRSRMGGAANTSFRPSRDKASAFFIMEQLRLRGWLVNLRCMPPGGKWIFGNHEHVWSADYYCSLEYYRIATPDDMDRRHYLKPVGYGDGEHGMQLAVSKCALFAAEIEHFVSQSESDAEKGGG